MAARHSGHYRGLSQTSALPRPWWSRVPQPLATAAMRVWGVLPAAVRASLSPIGRWINPPTTGPGPGPGPETVPGVDSLRAQGFEPIESYTGAVDVARLWPQEHRRWVPETRPGWLEDTDTAPDADDDAAAGRLWLVRSPWPTLGLRDCLNVLWSWAERDHARLDAELWRQRVSEALGWDETTAVAWHRRTAP